MRFVNDITKLDGIREIRNRNAQPPEIQVARLEMILEVSRALNASVELDTLLPAIADAAVNLTSARAAALLLLDRKSDELYLEAAIGLGLPESGRISMPMEHSIAGWIVQSGEVLVINDVTEKDSHFSEIGGELDFLNKAILGAPLIVNQTTIGVIEVFDKFHDSGFSNDDIHTLTLLGLQAAVAVENAFRFKESNELERAIRELDAPAASIIEESRLMLSSTGLTDDLQGGLRQINSAARRLSQIINEFLELSRLETGRVSLETRSVDLPVLIREAVEVVRPLAENTGVQIQLEPYREACRVEVDPDRLRLALVNLVEHALGYSTSDSSLVITLLCNVNRAQISVQSRGRGIAPDELGSIFEKFYHNTLAPGMEHGTGLALPLAKKVIEAHGGDIWIETREDEGCSFTFSLPVEAPKRSPSSG